MRLTLRNIFGIAALAMAVTTGCGNDHGQVTGRVVRSDGKPVEKARVIARSDDGKTAVGLTDDEGEFKLSASEPGTGVVAGEYTVIVVEDRGRTDNMRPATIPAKYADPSLSGLTLSVQTGESKTFDITVDSL